MNSSFIEALLKSAADPAAAGQDDGAGGATTPRR